MHDLKQTNKKDFSVKNRNKQKCQEFKIKGMPTGVYWSDFNPKLALKTDETETIHWSIIFDMLLL